MYALIKFFLFRLSPEKAHHITASLLKWVMYVPGVKSYCLKRGRAQAQPFTFAGLQFPSGVGLAAGFDKNASLFPTFGWLGFGFIEVGTVTPRPQPGNPKPRLFRLVKDEALINRMGFNNGGVDAMVSNLKRLKKPPVIIGGNIGKNKDTPNENAVDDYLVCFHQLHDHVDYFVVNVSSPNTPGLRELQEKGPLTGILQAMMTANRQKSVQRPIFLKIAPDLTHSQLDDIVDIVTETGIAGIIATNTTIDRNGLATESAVLEQIGNGGLSGKPLQQKSTEVIRYLREKSGGQIPVMGIGGITDAAGAREKLEAGADLVQVYTGFIYRGPRLIREINQAIENMRRGKKI